MLKKFFLPVLVAFSIPSIAQDTEAPSVFLGYELGDRFSRHHAVIEYYRHIAEHNNNVRLIPYGETYEHRPLMVAVISSPENMERLEEIRLNNIKRTGLLEDEAQKEDIAIVWLSYNIHGNEASSTEASMKTIYELIDPKNQQTKEWLKNTVVIIDPCVNPDGRDRYVNFFNQFSDRSFNPSGDAMEHREPWPGGRPNHYLFDLNRDWAWLSQQESKQRLEIYQQWMPHIHVDFHEQGYNSPYYFAPAAEPFHEVITPWQREFQTVIGKNNAKYFDEEGWLYFTKQRFDLLYPSYGDTYPTYNGAIGMTYEQAGHGFAGLGVITEYGDTLTLHDRIAHHHTTGLSTIEVASQNAERVAIEFEKYFNNSLNNPSSEYVSYIISGSNEQDKINRLLDFLDRHKIQYGASTSGGKRFTVYDYKTQKSSTISSGKNDIIISVHQPLGNLVSVLFEPQTYLTDTLTYDITAWSLPYAYGLNAYASNSMISISGDYKAPVKVSAKNIEKPYAYISKYSSFEDARFLAYLLKNKINVRAATLPFRLEGKDFNRGSLIITRRTNEQLGVDFDRIVRDGAGKFGRTLVSTQSGMADQGTDLGSSDVFRIRQPKIAVLGGEQVSTLSFGETWHFFEQQLDYPVTNIRTDYFKNFNLHDYNVLIVPGGNYNLFDETVVSKISAWVRAGGKLILNGNALNSFADTEPFALRHYKDDGEKKHFEDLREGISQKESLLPYEDIERNELSNYIFGAIYKVKMDKTHPLAYGYDEVYFSLKTSEARFSYLPNGGNVGVLEKDVKPVSGYAGYLANQQLSESLVFGVETMGSGSIVYLVDNPLFRAFWENGRLLYANAVFMVGN